MHYNNELPAHTTATTTITTRRRTFLSRIVSSLTPSKSLMSTCSSDMPLEVPVNLIFAVRPVVWIFVGRPAGGGAAGLAVCYAYSIKSG